LPGRRSRPRAEPRGWDRPTRWPGPAGPRPAPMSRWDLYLPRFQGPGPTPNLEPRAPWGQSLRRATRCFSDQGRFSAAISRTRPIAVVPACGHEGRADPSTSVGLERLPAATGMGDAGRWHCNRDLSEPNRGCGVDRPFSCFVVPPSAQWAAVPTSWPRVHQSIARPRLQLKPGRAWFPGFQPRSVQSGDSRPFRAWASAMDRGPVKRRVGGRGPPGMVSTWTDPEIAV